MLPLFESFIALYSVCLRTVELTPQRAFGITIPMKNQVEMDDAETGSKYIVVDCINGSFFLFSKKDAERSRDEFHIIPKGLVDTEEEVCYCLAPEQVTLLVEHGLAKVRVRKHIPTSLFNKGCITANAAPSKSEQERARIVVIGRKAKAIKRDKKGSGGTAKELKVTKQDMVGIDASTEELLEVVKELRMSKKYQYERSSTNSARITSDKHTYQYLEKYEVPVPCTREFRARQLVYHDLWYRGYFLTSGEQFGVAWLVYEGLPGDVHATYLVHFIFEDHTMSPMSLLGLLRVGVQVNKTLVLAVISSDSSKPHYVTIDWLRAQGAEDEEEILCSNSFLSGRTVRLQ